MNYRDLKDNDIDYEKLQAELIFLSSAYFCVKIIKRISKMLQEGKFDIHNT